MWFAGAGGFGLVDVAVRGIAERWGIGVLATADAPHSLLHGNGEGDWFPAPSLLLVGRNTLAGTITPRPGLSLSARTPLIGVTLLQATDVVHAIEWNLWY
jgi:hypothetical protein